MEWSTIVDAPTTYICGREEMKKFLIKEDVKKAKKEAEERLQRADEQGTSCISRLTVKELISANRAGEDESKLSLEEIRAKYKIREEKVSNENVKENK